METPSHIPPSLPLLPRTCTALSLMAPAHCCALSCTQQHLSPSLLHTHYAPPCHSSFPNLGPRPRVLPWTCLSQLLKDVRQGWYAAQRQCKTYGANLADVTSDAENNFIANLQPARNDQHPRWIGASTDASRVFTWAATGAVRVWEWGLAPCRMSCHRN